MASQGGGEKKLHQQPQKKKENFLFLWLLVQFFFHRPLASHCRKGHSETRYVYGMDGNRLTCPCTAPAVSHLTPTMPSLVVRGDIPSCATMRFGT